MLETERLLIKPLTYEQLVTYLEPDQTLETELGLNESSRHISPDLKEALELAILPNVRDPRNNYLYYTLWTMIDKEENRMVGDLCFKGEPNSAGEIEIGYGTYPNCQNKGYMSEAIKAMVDWAATQPRVLFVTAETEKDNVASMKVLEKCRFEPFNDIETMRWWRKAVR